MLKQFRNLGIGKALDLFMLEKLKNEKFIYLIAQESVIDFYDNLGFDSIGEFFYEAEIPHQKMVYSG